MTKYQKTALLLSCIFIPPLFLLFVRAFSTPTYVTSSLYKIVFLLPLVYRYYFHKKSCWNALVEGFSFTHFQKYISHALGWGMLFAGLYGSTFFLFKDMLSFSLISSTLESFASITPANILFIGLYIIVVNSLLEEFFWRGFFFNELHTLYGWFAAYVLTAVGFSLYHVAFFYSWFPFGLVLLATLGLFVYSLFMCMLFQKYQDLFTCWLIHALVDVVQIAIALWLFGLL
ncbi:MAG: type II CAAX endopeptidase family protein [Nanoarchaeota archaeon]